MSDHNPDEVFRIIMNLNTSHDELMQIVPIAEDIQFSEEQNSQLGPRLLEIALTYRDGTWSEDPEFTARQRYSVLSAIRTGSSMLKPADFYLLRPLLEAGHDIETVLVAVKMLGRMFEVLSPEDLKEYLNSCATHRYLLLDQVYVIAKALLNPYVLIAAESRALAQLAIYALVAMDCLCDLKYLMPIIDAHRSHFGVHFRKEILRLKTESAELFAKSS